MLLNTEYAKFGLLQLGVLTWQLGSLDSLAWQDYLQLGQQSSCSALY